MIVHAIQLDIDPNSRSRTLQRAMKAIDAAADLDPAPDLIALPAFGNALAALGGQSANFERAPGMVTASCGLRGRSWGVFLTVGLAEKSNGKKPHLTGMLLDRDADIRLLQRMTTPTSNPLKKAFEAGAQEVRVGKCLLGQFALLVGDDVLSEACWQAAVQGGAQFVIGTTCWPAGVDVDVEATVSNHAKSFGVPCVLADCTSSDESAKPKLTGHSFIIDATGSVLASAPPKQAAGLQAEIALPEPKTILQETLGKE